SITMPLSASELLARLRARRRTVIEAFPKHLWREYQELTKTIKTIQHESRDAPPNPEPINPTPLQSSRVHLEDVVRDMGSMFGRTVDPRISVESKWHDLKPVAGDRSMIDQALMNLVFNAMEAIEGEGGITIEALEAFRGFAMIRVSDTGAG